MTWQEEHIAELRRKAKELRRKAEIMDKYETHRFEAIELRRKADELDIDADCWEAGVFA